VVNRRKPRVQTPIVSLYPALALVHDFVLLFLPPCGPHLTPLAIGSLKPSLLVSPLFGGPASSPRRPSRTIEEVPVVCEYPDVFPEVLLGMPPDRDIEFAIDLIP
jgi:hypothetical protein